jgi:surface protein
MSLSTTFNPILWRNGEHYAFQVRFVDKPAPAGVELEDVSLAHDGGVVAWTKGWIYYISTQRPGVKVVAPNIQMKEFHDDYGAAVIDCTNLDISNLTSMSRMFENCRNLRRVIGCENWDTSHITDMSSMFAGCYLLESVDGLANWDTSAVTDMSYMFRSCKTLENVNALSRWDTSNVTNFARMFGGCTALESLTALADWNTHKVENMFGMLSYCPSLQDVSFLERWNITADVNIKRLFEGEGE